MSSCDNGIWGATDTPTIVGSLGSGFTATARGLGGGPVEELWLVRLQRGNDSVIYPGTVSRAEVFVPADDGKFEVVIANSDAEYALLAARPSESSPKDEIVAVLSFSVDEDSGSLILPTQGMSGDLNIGNISFVDGEGISSLTVDQSPGVIPSGGLSVLRQIAGVDNSVKLLINDYVNYHGSDAEYYTPEISLAYTGPTLESIHSETADSGDYSFDGITVFVFSEDADTEFTFESPSGVAQGSSGNYGANSASKWSLALSGPTIEEGWWKLLDADTSTVLAEYDLTIGYPLSPAGEPLSLVPFPAFELDDQGLVTGMTLTWVASNGSGAFSVTSPEALDTIIGKQEFSVQPNGVSDGGTGTTYMFDEIRGDQQSPRMFGDLTGFVFDQPFDPTIATSAQVWFRFGFYRVMVTFPSS